MCKQSWKHPEPRGPRVQDRALFSGLALLVALAGSLPSRADTAGSAETRDAIAAQAPSEPATPPKAPPSRAHSVLDERVETLSRALNLDAAQQSELRKVLAMQREQVEKVWNDSSVPSAYRISATRAIGNQTADRIRALLTEEQRKQFSQPSQRPDQAAPGALSLEDWMSATRTGHP